MDYDFAGGEHRPDKIEKLVYLAAYLIPDGKTQREYSIQDTGWCAEAM
jgi:hypothetical protein